MPSLSIDFKAFQKGIRQEFDVLREQQLPFAQVLAINEIAQAVVTAERIETQKDFDKPTAFTMNAFGFTPARKSAPTAVVFIKERQDRYLSPSIDGGVQVLGKDGGAKGVMEPVDIPLNSYGNIPAGRIKALLARPDVFAGRVKFKTGVEIWGIWQRADRAKQRRKPAERVKGKLNDYGAAQKTTLTLLVRAVDPVTVKSHFAYFERAETVIDRTAPAAMQRGLAKAMATAR